LKSHLHRFYIKFPLLRQGGARIDRFAPGCRDDERKSIPPVENIRWMAPEAIFWVKALYIRANS